MKNWTTAKLSEVLSQDFDSAEAVSPELEYEMVGVYSFGRGLFHKGKVQGIQTSYKTFYKLKSKHIVMSQLFGWEGALALSSEDFAGKYVSSQFPTFLANEEKAERDFIGYFLRLPKIWEMLFNNGKGMGSRRRTLNPNSLLSLSIPLPSLPEQRRIITKLEAVRRKIEQVKQLRADQEKTFGNLLFSKYREVIDRVGWKEMGKVAPLVRREVKIEETATYPELGVRSFGKGTFHKPALSGIEVGTKRIYAIKPGDLVFGNVFAWEGAIAVATEADAGRYGSHRFITCVTDRNEALPEFLCYHFLTEKGLEDINAASPGGAGRNKTLGLKKLEKIKVPLPDIEKQREFLALKEKIERLASIQKAQLTALEGVFLGLLDKAFQEGV